MDQHNVVILQNLRSYAATSLIHGLFVCYSVYSFLYRIEKSHIKIVACWALYTYQNTNHFPGGLLNVLNHVNLKVTYVYRNVCLSKRNYHIN